MFEGIEDLELFRASKNVFTAFRYKWFLSLIRVEAAPWGREVVMVYGLILSEWIYYCTFN